MAEALDLLGHPELRPQTPVRRLSLGAQQLVEIARALVTEARVIVFDEPTSSLTQHDAEQLFEVIDKLRRSQLGIVYISHFLEEVRRVCDRFVVLRDGQVAGGGPVAGASEAEIVRLMAGRAVEELFPQVPHEPGEPILSLEGLSGARLPRDVSLSSAARRDPGHRRPGRRRAHRAVAVPAGAWIRCAAGRCASGTWCRPPGRKRGSARDWRWSPRTARAKGWLRGARLSTT